MKSSFSKHWKLNMYLCVNKNVSNICSHNSVNTIIKAVISTLHLDVYFYEKFNEIKQNSKISNSFSLNPVGSN